MVQRPPRMREGAGRPGRGRKVGDPRLGMETLDQGRYLERKREKTDLSRLGVKQTDLPQPQIS